MSELKQYRKGEEIETNNIIKMKEEESEWLPFLNNETSREREQKKGLKEKRLLVIIGEETSAKRLNVASQLSIHWLSFNLEKKAITHVDIQDFSTC